MKTNPEDATAWPWRFSSGDASGSAAEPTPTAGLPPPPPEFFRRPAEVVAPDLLGMVLATELEGERTAGVIVEAEAYVGPDDPASHARASVGRTPRNRSMFGPPGIAYVYRSYGIHWCMNVVTGAVDHPVAVLVRALDPLEGTETMIERRGRTTELCAGPGRLTQALGITGEHDGHDLSRPPLYLTSGWSVNPELVGASGRIGIRHAADWPLRFYLRGHPSVSGSPRR